MRRLLWLLVAMALVAAGCGGSFRFEQREQRRVVGRVERRHAQRVRRRVADRRVRPRSAKTYEQQNPGWTVRLNYARLGRASRRRSRRGRRQTCTPLRARSTRISWPPPGSFFSTAGAAFATNTLVLDGSPPIWSSKVADPAGPDPGTGRQARDRRRGIPGRRLHPHRPGGARRRPGRRLLRRRDQERRQRGAERQGHRREAGQPGDADAGFVYVTRRHRRQDRPVAGHRHTRRGAKPSATLSDRRRRRLRRARTSPRRWVLRSCALARRDSSSSTDAGFGAAPSP